MDDPTQARYVSCRKGEDTLALARMHTSTAQFIVIDHVEHASAADLMVLQTLPTLSRQPVCIYASSSVAAPLSALLGVGPWCWLPPPNPYDVDTLQLVVGDRLTREQVPLDWLLRFSGGFTNRQLAMAGTLAALPVTVGMTSLRRHVEAAWEVLDEESKRLHAAIISCFWDLKSTSTTAPSSLPFGHIEHFMGGDSVQLGRFMDLCDKGFFVCHCPVATTTFRANWSDVVVYPGSRVWVM